jgi:hypothetical protein
VADYLAAWDLREGWRGDHYDSSQEQTLREIARRFQAPVSTAANRYRSAFRLIVGHDYSPALWARVLGALKVSEWLDPQELPRRTLRRPWRERQPRAVPESVLQAPGAGPGRTGLLDSAGVSEAKIDYVDLVLDVQQLLAEGRSNAEIAAALELTSPSAEELIDHLRQRHQDSLERTSPRLPRPGGGRRPPCPKVTPPPASSPFLSHLPRGVVSVLLRPSAWVRSWPQQNPSPAPASGSDRRPSAS